MRPATQSLNRPGGNRPIADCSLSWILAETLATFALVVTAGLCFLALLPMLGGYGSVVVGSGSMTPSLQVADVVITSPPGPEQVRPGTIINYLSAQGPRIHRVVSIEADGYQTKGDANAMMDSTLVTHSQITGVGIVVVPLVGLPRHWLDSGESWKLGLVALGLVLSLAILTRRVRPERPTTLTTSLPVMYSSRLVSA